MQIFDNCSLVKLQKWKLVCNEMEISMEISPWCDSITGYQMAINFYTVDVSRGNFVATTLVELLRKWNEIPTDLWITMQWPLVKWNLVLVQ